ncbi:hypothetical protein [Streptomyces sp. WAC05374]|uniref:hypothetical protein n=1 Tax=Streptomyces sp. WAC05374 TaxID=2487420 RepID=UPI00135CDA98|nr:hypothetical protein [Streptomyces sp. WAC05374]
MAPRLDPRCATVVAVLLLATPSVTAYAEETGPAAEPDVGVVRPTGGASDRPVTTPPSASAAASVAASAGPSTGPGAVLGPTRNAAASPSLAGRSAGEGRQRPGRPVSPSPSPSGDVSRGSPAGPADPARTKTATAPGLPWGEEAESEAVPETESPAAADPPRSPPAAAYEPAAQTADTLADRQIPVLTLGVGLAMMGLGLGFLGLRMRRR